MRWVRPLAADLADPVGVIGAKAGGLVLLRRLGLPVPEGFVVTTAACRAFRRDGRPPAGLREELVAAVAGVEAATGRRLGGVPPLAVSVRSGAEVSMPGMMSTVLGLGLTTAATGALAAETGDPGFALDSRRRFLASSAAAGVAHLPDDAVEQLERAVGAVFASWDSPRARTYRTLHGIPHDLGTAVVVQAMVFGNRDDRSAGGVAFSRDPTTGEPGPFGEVVFRGQGDDAVAGAAATLPLDELRVREPGAWAELRGALERIEAHHRDACSVELTVESGALWFLQVRREGSGGAAAVRVATDLVDEGVIGRDEALLRLSARHLRDARVPRIAPGAEVDVLARGVGACPGVAVGRVATSADGAVRMAVEGPVVLVRPETSPLDVHGIGAAAGVVTARGGPAGHAAVVARSMGRPAVVGVAGLVVEDGVVRVGGRVVAEGALVGVDGGSGVVVLGRPPVVEAGDDDRLARVLGWADAVAGDARARPDVERLAAAHAVLRARAASAGR
ncbi:PEP/pyruvate-binding domain-containing protein [Pseudonocardia humida]|uniref:Pyruvate, phosphate dikinase n=1 Tax=Pseudonocardia humida TaxID=2800819 RepID=A0ABT0ZTV1_9PSEU|nr:PEP/pyruvate-binding domain-containing protein [Pseudonocardia humida]MCO1654160.1 pyruvate, phosphate dikinase [Pseudonocardia humida]